VKYLQVMISSELRTQALRLLDHADSPPLLGIQETTVFLAVIPCRNFSRNNRYERRATIPGSNRFRKIAAPQLL